MIGKTLCNKLISPMKSTSQKANINKEDQKEQLEEFWSQHRTTLISYETQFVHATRPQSQEKREEEKPSKGKKKNIEYQGGFLFPGRAGDKDENISQLIEGSKYSHLKELFEQRPNIPRQTLRLRQFIKIMLELKHNSILKQFLEIYQMIVREIKDIKFEAIRTEKDRFHIVDEISNKVAGFVVTCSYLFNCFNKYMKQHKKQTTQLFKVTIYCFLAEKYNFNINQFYSQAFDYPEEDAKKPKKKKKLQEASLAQ